MILVNFRCTHLEIMVEGEGHSYREGRSLVIRLPRHHPSPSLVHRLARLVLGLPYEVVVQPRRDVVWAHLCKCMECTNKAKVTAYISNGKRNSRGVRYPA